MTNRSSVNKTDVLHKLLEGKSYQTIANELGISKSAVANAVEKLREEIARKNLDMLLEMASAVKKSDTSFAQILSCARTYKILEKQNLDDEHVYELLTEIISKINNKIELSELIETTKDVFDFQESSGMSLQEVRDFCDEKNKEIKSLDEKLNDSKEKTKQSISVMKDTLAENNITKEDLNDYVNSRNYLEKNGAQIDELSSVVNMIKNSSKGKHDSKTIITQISENDSLEQRNADLEAQNSQIVKQNQTKIKENQELDQIMDDKRQPLEQVENFEKIGVSPDYLLSLYQKIADIGEKKKISAPKIIEKFTKDVEIQYEQKMGFENTLNQLKQEIDSKQQEREKIIKENTELSAKTRVLRKEKVKLEAAFEEYKNIIIKTTQDMSFEQKKNYAELIKYEKMSTSLIGSRLNSIIKDMIKNLNDEHRKNMNTWDEKASEISKMSEEFGHYEYLRVLSDTARGVGTPSEAYSSVIIMVTGFQRWLEENNIKDIVLLTLLESLKKNIEERMKKNAQAA